MPSFEPQIKDRDLAPLMQRRLELSGAPRQLHWPDVCAHCGGPTTQRLPVRKVFHRRYRHSRNRYVIATADVPFCPTCIAQHAREAPVLSPAERALSYVRTFAIVPLAGAVVMATITWEPLQGAAAGDERRTALAIFGFFAAIAIGSVFACWLLTRRFRVPPQSEITRACDFSDELGNPISGSRRVYALRNAAFAAAFAAANAQHVWTPERHAHRRGREAVVLVLVVALGLALWLLRTFGSE
jgi:hypothetical protein